MCNWNYVGLTTLPASSLASKTLRDHLGQPLIGQHIVIFQEFYIKLKKEQPKPLLCTYSALQKNLTFC